MTPAEIIAEFRKKYEGCYMHVQMPDSTEENLFYLATVQQQRGETTSVLKLESEEFGKIQLNMGTAHTLKFKFPNVGTFQSGKDAFYFRRDPRRQWRRGLCTDNAVIYPVHAAIASSGNEMNFTRVNDAFKGVYYTYKTAIKMLAGNKYRSVALADGFAVMLSPVLDCVYLLLFRMTPIARIGADGNVMAIIENAFEPQIKQITQ